jgi:hypothetical protein
MSESNEAPKQNTDVELWREPPGDYYANSVHVTAGGGLGINVGGTVIVKPLAAWHALAAQPTDPQRRDGCPVTPLRLRAISTRMTDVWDTADVRKLADWLEQSPEQAAPPSDELTGTADDQLWSREQVAVMPAALKEMSDDAAPSERPEELKRAIRMLERNRASLVFAEKRPHELVHFLELAIRWGLALESQLAQVTAEREAMRDENRDLWDFLGELDTILECPQDSCSSAKATLEETARLRMQERDQQRAEIAKLRAALDGLIDSIAEREDTHGERFHISIRQACAVGETALADAPAVEEPQTGEK